MHKERLEQLAAHLLAVPHSPWESVFNLKPEILCAQNLDAFNMTCHIATGPEGRIVGGLAAWAIKLFGSDEERRLFQRRKISPTAKRLLDLNPDQGIILFAPLAGVNYQHWRPTGITPRVAATALNLCAEMDKVPKEIWETAFQETPDEQEQDAGTHQG